MTFCLVIYSLVAFSLPQAAGVDVDVMIRGAS